MILRVARHEEDFDPRPGMGQALCQDPAADAGHDRVCQEEVDGARIMLAELDSFGPVRGFQHRISTRLQHEPRKRPDVVVILHQQHSFGTCGQVGGFGGGAGRFGGHDFGQVNLESRSVPRLTIDVNVTPGLFDDAVHGG